MPSLNQNPVDDFPLYDSRLKNRYDVITPPSIVQLQRQPLGRSQRTNARIEIT